MTTRTPTKTAIRRALLTAYDKAQDSQCRAEVALDKANNRLTKARCATASAKKACADAGLKVDEPQSEDVGAE